MCIAVPGCILEMDEGKAQVAIMGIEEEINILFLEDVKVGDWVLVHTGYAIGKIEKKSAKELEALLERLVEEQ